jgi:hypothetical protein
VKRLAFLVFTALLTTGRVSAVVGAQVDTTDVKAAYVYNFAKFAEWPEFAPNDPIILCVLDDPQLAMALSVMTRGQHIGAHRLEVRTVGSVDGQACHILYVSTRAGELAPIFQVLRGTPTLTVGDTQGFAASGGMIELFADGDRMRFAVNVAAVQRSALKLSSRLLGLARIVKDDRAQ